MRVVIRITLLVLLPAFGVSACRSPRLGTSGDTCGRTDDCEAPLRCLGAVCRDGLADSEGRVLPRTANDARPRGELPPLTTAPMDPTTPPAVLGGQLATRPPDETAIPAAGVPGVH